MKSMDLRIPGGLAASCRKTPKRAAWLRRLPDVLRNLEHRWSLTLDTPFDGEEVSCSYVAAVVRADGTSAVLKIGMPQMEGEHEIHGLRFWDGDPTVRLLMADDDLGAMLLERCEPGTVLRTLPEREQDVVISGLLRRLWRAPSAQHPFRPLSALTEDWSAKVCASLRSCPAPNPQSSCWLQTCTQATSSGRDASHGSSSTQSPSSEILPTTRRSTCSIVLRDCDRTGTE